MITDTLDISTRYVPQHVMNALEDGLPEFETSPMVISHESGYFVSVSADWRTRDEPNYDGDTVASSCPSLALLLDHAAASGYDWIKLGTDGSDIDAVLPDGSAFPTWNW